MSHHGENRPWYYIVHFKLTPPISRGSFSKGCVTNALKTTKPKLIFFSINEFMRNLEIRFSAIIVHLCSKHDLTTQLI